MSTPRSAVGATTEDWSAAGYTPGLSAITSNGSATAAERKSPPLTAFVDNPQDHCRVSARPYHDPAHAALEWERLWSRTWLCAGRLSDLAQPGDWLRFDFAGESFIVMRSEADAISAFYNVCQHRANRLVVDDFGHAASLVCPYHSWRYDRTGRCVHVTDRAFFQPAALAGSIDIPRIRCESFGGFVFITLSDETGPLADFLGEVGEIVAGYRLEELEVRADVDLALDCNWKVMLDAFSEVYHAHITHPATTAIIEDRFNQMDFYPGGHSRRIVPVGNPALRRGPATLLNPTQRAFLAGTGIDPDTFAGNARDVRRQIQIAKRAMAGRPGEIYRSLSDNQLTDDWAMNVFPNMHWSLHAEGMQMLRYIPHATDPNRSILNIQTLGYPGIGFDMYLPDGDRAEGARRPQRIRVSHDDPDVASVIGQLLYEDIRNTRETQQGMKSRGFGGLRLSDHEQVLMYQHAELTRHLVRE